MPKRVKKGKKRGETRFGIEVLANFRSVVKLERKHGHVISEIGGAIRTLAPTPHHEANANKGGFMIGEQTNASYLYERHKSAGLLVQENRYL